MPNVSVKYKYGPAGKKADVLTSTSVSVSRKPPTESEVMAALKKTYPNREIVIIEIK